MTETAPKTAATESKTVTELRQTIKLCKQLERLLAKYPTNVVTRALSEYVVSADKDTDCVA